MAYSKKVVEKFENTLNEPEKNSVGRWDPSDSDIGTGMVGAPTIPVPISESDGSHLPTLFFSGSFNVFSNFSTTFLLYAIIFPF